MGGKRCFTFKDWFLYWFVFYFVSSMLGLAGPAFAQDQDKEKDEFTLEEIVVTAEKREAELQKIPMDVAVVRPDDMERLNIHQMSELQKMIPDLQSSDGGGGTGFLQLSIRGINTDYWNPTAETTVAVQIDGVSLTRSNAMEGKFYDLERVEMNKGPQGTLYGRGSTSGSLTMVSKKPDIGEFGGNIQLEYGSFDRRRIEGALNIPATDKLAFRLSGRSIKRGAEDDVGISVQDMWGLRGSMRWEPTDRQSLQVIASTDSSNNRGGYGYNGVYFQAFGDVEIVANPDPTLSDAFRKYASGGTVSTPYMAKWYYTKGMESEQQNRMDAHDVSINYDHEFDLAWWTVQYAHRSSKTNLKYVTAQTPTLQPLGTTTLHSWWGADTIDLVTGEITPSGTAPGNDGYGEAHWDYTNFTQSRDAVTGELIPVTQFILYPSVSPSAVSTLSNSVSRTNNIETRLTSQDSIANGDKTEWIGGAMYMDDMVTEIAQITENAYNNVILREYALFGQASYAPFARLNFTAGYRYTWDNKKFNGYTYGTGYNASGPDNNLNIRYAREMDPDMHNHYSYHVGYSTYKFNLSWQATDNILPYIQYSKGMKSLNVGRDGKNIPPEQLNSIEGGAKTRFFNGRLQLNLSGYYYEYKNKNDWISTYQCRIPVFDGQGDANGGLGNFTGCKQIGETANNALDRINNSYGILSPGGAKQHGGSAQIIWVITPADMFTLNASYQHNEYYKYSQARAMLEAYGLLWGESTIDGVTITNVHSALLADSQVDKTGDEFGGRPWRGNFTYSHIWFFGTDMLTGTLSGFYEGEGLTEYIARHEAVERTYPGDPDYWTFDMSFNYSSSRWVPEGYQWSVRVFGNNILDNDALANRTWNDGYNAWFKSQSYTLPANSGYISGSFLAPRTLGVQVSLYF